MYSLFSHLILFCLVSNLSIPCSSSALPLYLLSCFLCSIGIPNNDILKELKKKNIYTIVVCTTVEEGILCNNNGYIDAIVASGSDGGGHRGSFLKPIQESLIGVLVEIFF